MRVQILSISSLRLPMFRGLDARYNRDNLDHQNYLRALNLCRCLCSCWAMHDIRQMHRCTNYRLTDGSLRRHGRV